MIDATRRALLAAAHDLLATEGPGALTVRRMAATAGVSTMNVYSRFGGKDGVLDELFIDGFRRLTATMEAAPSSDDTMSDLRQCGACYRRFALENPTYYSLMFDRVVPDFEPSDAAVAVALASLGELAARVQRAMDAGRLRPGDAFTVASALWACEHGLVSLELRTADERGQAFDWEAIAPLAVNAMLDGLAR
jgi:AcrR family transcriptional regulator